MKGVIDMMRRLIERAKYVARQKRPYLSRVIGRLVYVKDVAGLGGYMAVDRGGRLYVDPDLIKRCCQDLTRLDDLSAWDFDLLADIITHEALHILLNHHDRGQNKETRRWHIATDIAINDDIKPPEYLRMLMPKMFGLPDHRSEETYYEMLESEANLSKSGKQEKLCGGGSGATGKKGSYELDEADPENPAIPPEVMDEIRDQTAQDIISYQKSVGYVPDYLLRWASDRLKVKVNWQRLIGRFVETQIRKSHEGVRRLDWKRPNRRLDLKPFHMPRWIKTVPDIVIIADTSASMSEKDIAIVLAGIDDALRQFGQLMVVVWDATLQGVKQISRIAELKDIMKGGGGTTMNDAIEWVNKNLKETSVIIVLTDGETEWGKPSRIPVAAIIINNVAIAPQWD